MVNLEKMAPEQGKFPQDNHEPSLDQARSGGFLENMPIRSEQVPVLAEDQLEKPLAVTAESLPWSVEDKLNAVGNIPVVISNSGTGIRDLFQEYEDIMGEVGSSPHQTVEDVTDLRQQFQAE